MENKDFMKQKAEDMTVEELRAAVKIKSKELNPIPKEAREVFKKVREIATKTKSTITFMSNGELKIVARVGK